MKKENGIALIWLILLTLVLFVALVGGFSYMFFNEDVEEKSSKKQDREEVEEIENHNNIEDIESEEDINNENDNLEEWYGVYTNLGDTEIVLYQAYEENCLTFDIIRGTTSVSGYTVELNSEDSFIYEDESFGVEVVFEVTKTTNGIKVKASSTATEDDIENIYNEISGNYTKEEIEKIGWEGIYENGDIIITLSELRVGEVECKIQKEYNRSILTISDVTETILIDESEFLDDINKITIEKTDTGIDVVASSTDSEDLFNLIDGEYTKIK